MFSDSLKFEETLVPTMRRGRGISSALDLKGRYTVEHYRKGKLLNNYAFNNGITDAAKNDLLDVYFNDGTKKTTWYIGLINNSGFTALATTDTLSSHGGWTEFSSYELSSEVTTDRPAWGQGAAATKQLTNASAVSYIFTGSGTIAGIFVCSQQVKASSTGTLWSTGLFGAALAVETDDELRVTYTLGA